MLGHAGLSIYFLLTKESAGGNEILTSWGTGRAPLGGLIRRCTCTPRNGFASPGDRTRRLQDPTRGVYDRQLPTTVEPLSTAFSHIPPRGVGEYSSSWQGIYTPSVRSKLSHSAGGDARPTRPRAPLPRVSMEGCKQVEHQQFHRICPSRLFLCEFRRQDQPIPASSHFGTAPIALSQNIFPKPPQSKQFKCPGHLHD